MDAPQIGRQAFNLLKVCVCAFGLVTTFYMVVDLTYFLSVPKKVKSEFSSRGNKQFWNFNVHYKLYLFTDNWVITSWALLSNMFLLSLFILQHSLLASKIIKEAFSTYGLQPIYRSLYVITTSGILLVKNYHC